MRRGTYATNHQILLHVLEAVGDWQTLDQLEFKTGIKQATLSATLRNLRKSAYGSHEIARRYSKDEGVFEYRLRP